MKRVCQKSSFSILYHVSSFDHTHTYQHAKHIWLMFRIQRTSMRKRGLLIKAPEMRLPFANVVGFFFGSLFIENKKSNRDLWPLTRSFLLFLTLSSLSILSIDFTDFYSFFSLSHNFVPCSNMLVDWIKYHLHCFAIHKRLFGDLFYDSYKQYH